MLNLFQKKNPHTEIELEMKVEKRMIELVKIVYISGTKIHIVSLFRVKVFLKSIANWILNNLDCHFFFSIIYIISNISFFFFVQSK